MGEPEQRDCISQRPTSIFAISDYSTTTNLSFGRQNLCLIDLPIIRGRLYIIYGDLAHGLVGDFSLD